MQNYLNLYLPFKQQQLYGPVNYRGFRETGPYPHLVLGNKRLSTRTKWCCVYNLNTQCVTVYIGSPFCPVRRHVWARVLGSGTVPKF